MDETKDLFDWAHNVGYNALKKPEQIDTLIQMIRESEEAKRVLRDKGYGWTGLSLLGTVMEEVPHNNYFNMNDNLTKESRSNEIQLRFTVDQYGSPMIEFTHFDKRDDLLHKVVGVFVRRALSEGIKIFPVSGHMECGKPHTSFEKYVIKIGL